MTQEAYYRKWLRDLLSSRLPKSSIKQAYKYGIYSAHTFQLELDEPYITLYDKDGSRDDAVVTFGKNLKPVDKWLLTHLANDFQFKELRDLPEPEKWRNIYHFNKFTVSTKVGEFTITTPMLTNSSPYDITPAWLQDVVHWDNRYIELLFNASLNDTFINHVSLETVTFKVADWQAYVNYFEFMVPDKLSLDEAYDELRKAYDARIDREIRDLKVKLIQRQSMKFTNEDYAIRQPELKPPEL